MINKVINTLTDDVLDALAGYGIKMTKQYTPQIPDTQFRFSRNFFIGNMSKWGRQDIDNPQLFQNRLNYNIGTPKRNRERLANINLNAVIPNTSEESDYSADLTRDESLGYYGGYRLSIDRKTPSGSTPSNISRSVSLLDIPVNFAVVSSSSDLIFDLCLLLDQIIYRQPGMEVSVNLDNDVEFDVPFFIDWQIDDTNVNYADFEQGDSLHILEFSCIVSGAFFSNFARTYDLIEEVTTTVEKING